METSIPFSGFYESIHDAEIDRAMEYCIQNSRGDVNPGLAEAWYAKHTFDYSKIQNEYSREYLSRFEGYFNAETGLKITLKFSELISPREYNFTTDRIFAKISRESVRALWRKVDREILDKLISEKFSSRSGFISFYPNTLAEWLDRNENVRSGQSGGPVETWDSNMVGTLLKAVMATCEITRDWEWNVIEDMDGNGDVSNIVYGALTDDGKRIVKIADYLREREDRKYA